MAFLVLATDIDLASAVLTCLMLSSGRSERKRLKEANCS